MKIRIKFLLVLIFLATVASVAFGVSSYYSAKSRLYAEIDQSLDDASHHVLDDIRRGEYADTRTRPSTTPPPETADGAADGKPKRFDEILVQLLYPDGSIRYQTTAEDAPIRQIEIDIAAGRITTEQFGTVEEPGEPPYRVLTTPILEAGGGAVEVGRSLAETERLLESFRDRTILIMLAVIAAAGLVGWFLARQVTRRIEQLTVAAESVSKSGQLDVAVATDGRDETARLARAFNQMLAKLATSKDAQRRLVQDAGHELRTPLTSLRTNVSLLRRYEQLGPTEHGRVLDDLELESKELTTLVNQLIELATTEQHSDQSRQAVSLRSIVEPAVERARRRTGRVIVVDVDDSSVLGQPHALERAVANLLDNATKFTEGDDPIEVCCEAGRISVCDHGPGFDEDDLDRVFDRFYRAPGMRSLPGSGLGLSIVKSVAEMHGGSATAANRPGGGAVVTIELPTIIVPVAEDPTGQERLTSTRSTT